MYPYYTGDSYVYMEGGEQVIDDTFSSAEPFRNGFAIVEKNGKAGVINTDGKFIIKPEFDRIISLSDNIICFKAANYHSKEKKSWTIFGMSRHIEAYVDYKLYDANGKSFYSYSGRDEFDPPIYAFKDRIFVQGKKTEVFTCNGKGRIKSLRVLKNLYFIVDHNSWLKKDGDYLSLCNIDSNKCSAEAYTAVQYPDVVLIKDNAGKHHMIQWAGDGLKEVGMKGETLTLTTLLSPAQQHALQQLPSGLRMDWNRTFDDGSAVLRNSEQAFYISLDGHVYELPLHSRVSYISPDTLILTRGSDPWEMCIYNPVDGEFVLAWQASTLRTLGKSRERFVMEKDGIATVIDRQANTISAEYKSIKITADPLLYLADDVYILATDGMELRGEHKN